MVTTKAKNVFDENFFDEFSYAIQRLGWFGFVALRPKSTAMVITCMFKRQKVRQIGTAYSSALL